MMSEMHKASYLNKQGNHDAACKVIAVMKDSTKVKPKQAFGMSYQDLWNCGGFGRSENTSCSVNHSKSCIM